MRCVPRLPTPHHHRAPRPMSGRAGEAGAPQQRASLRLTFLGPAGTFSEEAALRYDAAAQQVPMASITAVATAVGTRRFADIFGAEILARGIQDRSPNLTRFVVLGKQDSPPSGDDNTSLACAFAVEDRPGLLVGALKEFSDRSINLSKIESRPSREKLGTYIFLMDVD